MCDCIYILNLLITLAFNNLKTTKKYLYRENILFSNEKGSNYYDDVLVQQL